MGKRDLTGQRVIVTGASAGIGWHAALRFAEAGCRVALAVRREDRLARLHKRISTLGGEALALPTDVSDAEACQRLVDRVREQWGGVDILVNNAGVGRQGLVTDLSLDDFRALIETNYLGVVALTKAALPAMLERRAGHIINVSSVIGARAVPLSSAYCATKFALNGFTESLRAEVADSGVAVSLIQPGLTRTEFSAVATRDTHYAPAAGSRRGRERFAQSADHVAKVIVRCAERPRAVVTLTLAGRALLAADWLAPRLVDVAMRHYAMRSTRTT